ncbi:MAG TPA: hypothetical protein PK443_00315 [bacterium]|nr:hypothetical protein [bacterium]
MKKVISTFLCISLMVITSCGTSKPTAEQQTALLAGISEYGVFGIVGEELVTAMFAGEIVSGQKFELSTDCTEGTVATSGIVTFTINGSKLNDVEFDVIFDMKGCKIDMRDVLAEATLCGKAPIITITGELQLKGIPEELVMTGYFIEGVFNNQTFSCGGQITMNMDDEDFPKTGEVCGTDVNTLMEYMEELDKPIEEQEFCAV